MFILAHPNINLEATVNGALFCQLQNLRIHAMTCAKNSLTRY